MPSEFQMMPRGIIRSPSILKPPYGVIFIFIVPLYTYIYIYLFRTESTLFQKCAYYNLVHVTI